MCMPWHCALVCTVLCTSQWCKVGIVVVYHQLPKINPPGASSCNDSTTYGNYTSSSVALLPELLPSALAHADPLPPSPFSAFSRSRPLQVSTCTQSYYYCSTPAHPISLSTCLFCYTNVYLFKGSLLHDVN